MFPKSKVLLKDILFVSWINATVRKSQPNPPSFLGLIHFSFAQMLWITLVSISYPISNKTYTIGKQGNNRRRRERHKNILKIVRRKEKGEKSMKRCRKQGPTNNNDWTNKMKKLFRLHISPQNFFHILKLFLPFFQPCPICEKPQSSILLEFSLFSLHDLYRNSIGLAGTPESVAISICRFYITQV